MPGSIPIYKNDSGNCQYGTNHGSDRWNQNPITETISGKELLERVSAKVTATTKDTWNLTDSSQLTDKFKQIAGETLTFACSNVKITDQLSEYVEVTENSKLHVKIAERFGTSTYRDKYNQIFDLSGGTVTLNSQKIADVRYDNKTKTAVLDFVDNYKLEENYYYYISITKVKATDKAYEDYIKYGGYKTDQGAPIVGSTPTDTSATKDNEFGYYATNGSDLTGGAISSGKFGFKSNADAKVEYTWKGTAKTEDYLDPVIQVSVDQIKVEKDWAELGDTNVSKNVVLAQLVKLSTEKDDVGNDVIIETPVAGKIIKLADSNNFSGAFIVRDASDYAIRELKLDANGSITYEGKKYSIANEDDVTTFDNISYKVSYATTEDSGKSVTITNTKSSETIRIIKAGTDTSLLLEGAEFTLVDSSGNKVTVGTTATEGGSYISDAKGLVLEGIINAGTYTLTEIKAPSGYIKLAESITITVGSDDDNKVTVSGPEGKVTCAKYDHNVYVITVQNEVIYELPSTGGSGIYWFSICGMLLMMAATWIIYKNKCREVLVK